MGAPAAVLAPHWCLARHHFIMAIRYSQEEIAALQAAAKVTHPTYTPQTIW